MSAPRRPKLPHRRVLTVLTIAGLATAVALPVVLLSVGGGVYAHEESDLTDAGYQIAVSAAGDHSIDGAHGLVEEIGAFGGVQDVSPVLSSAVEVWYGSSASPVLAEGVIPGPFLATQVPEESSLFPHPLPLGDPTDTQHYAGGRYDGPSAGRILLSTPFAAARGIGIGDSVRVAAGLNASPIESFQVAGFFGVAGPTIGPTAVFGAVLPLSDLQPILRLAGGPGPVPLDAADTIEVGLTPSAAASVPAIDRIAGEIARLVPYYTVTTLDNEAGQLAQAEGVLQGFYLGLSAVGLVIGLAFLTLVLLREVEAERRSIGIRRALGLSGWEVARPIVGRGAALATAGAVSGIGLGTVIVRGLATWASGDVATVAMLAVFDPETLLALALAVVSLGLLGSAFAVRTALRMPLPEVLR